MPGAAICAGRLQAVRGRTAGRCAARSPHPVPARSHPSKPTNAPRHRRALRRDRGERLPSLESQGVRCTGGLQPRPRIFPCEPPRAGGDSDSNSHMFPLNAVMSSTPRFKGSGTHGVWLSWYRACPCQSSASASCPAAGASVAATPVMGPMAAAATSNPHPGPASRAQTQARPARFGAGRGAGAEKRRHSLPCKDGRRCGGNGAKEWATG